MWGTCATVIVFAIVASDMNALDAQILGHLDSPTGWTRFAETVDVVGWTFATDASDVELIISIDGRPVVTSTPDLVREDVSEAYGVPHAVLSGFRFTLTRDLVDVPANDTIAEFTLAVDLRSASGLTKRLGDARLEWVRTPDLERARGDYRSVWDGVSRSIDDARISVAGYTDDAEWERTGVESAELLRRELRLGSDDVVMEIGCGAGRIAHHLAPHVKQWVGGDVSKNMLAHAAEALVGVANVSFVELAGSDLRAVSDDSLDAIYCTVVFMHLDEWDRYRYVREMLRVLKPGGRMYIDNYNLLSEEGWSFFLEMSAIDPVHRPANISKSSTPQELRAFAERAGFAEVVVRPAALFVSVTATKPI